MAYSNLSNLDFFGDLQNSPEMVIGKRRFEIMIKNKFEHYNQFCGLCVSASENQNLSNAQKELLSWHRKWGISMHRIQEMMKLQQFAEPNGTRYIMPPVISAKLATAATCAVPACESWLLGRVKKRSPGVSKVKYVPDKEGILALDKYEVGDFFSTDKFVIPTSGRIPTVYGSKHHHNLFHSGTIYYDAASGLIWVENQVSLGINETV